MLLSLRQICFCSLAIVVISITTYHLCWYDIAWWSCLVIGCAWSITLVLYAKFSNSKRIFPYIEESRKSFYSFEKAPVNDAVKERGKGGVPVGLQPIISELVELILRDFVLSWYKEIVHHDTEAFLLKVRADMDYICDKVCSMLSSVEYLQFITEDIPEVLNDHLRQVQMASTLSQAAEDIEPFVLHECARSEKIQREHLTILSTLICNKVLPSGVDSVSRKLAVAVFTSQVLEPTIESISSPDSINQSLLSYLTNQEQVVSNFKRTFSYAASYEDFVEMIIKCQDIEELKQIRYHIITEVMFSTTLQGLKKSETESDTTSYLAHAGRTKAVNKVEMLRGRDLKQYVNQLRIAKTKCEKRIIQLGGEEYAEYFTTEDHSSNQQRGHKVISFKLTMHSLQCRGCFHAFLKADDSESLLEFWVAVETLKSTDVSERHRLAAEIYNRYISHRVSIIRLEKALLRGMESFLMGNRGPEAFYDSQDVVYHQLEENHYPQFLVSDVYHNFIIHWDSSESTNSGEATSYGSTEDYEEDFQDIDDSDLLTIQNTQSEYNKKKIADIDERIFNKTQGYQALSSQITDMTNSKYTAVLTELERELETLKLERRGLEAHQEQVGSWWRHVGQWSASVVQHELVKENEGWRVYYVILIRLQDQVLASPAHRNGWVVSRTLQQIRELHHDLCQIDENLIQLSLPSKVRIGKPSEDYINKSKTLISNFLQWVIFDKTLSQSSELFHFVSTHPHLNTESVRKSTIFRVPRIFKRKQETDSNDSADLLFYDNNEGKFWASFNGLDFLYMLYIGRCFLLACKNTQEGKTRQQRWYKKVRANLSAKELRSKDSIAGPLYSLISEIFELKGASKLLRKTLVQLVQVTYGKSINRQLRETVSWMVSEPMIVYYLKFWRDFFWPSGVLAPPAPHRTDEMKVETQAEAKSALIRNIPDLLIRIFGDKSSRHGLRKLFDTFQDQTLNKHFVFMLLSRFTDRILPEVVAARQAKAARDSLSGWTMPSCDVPSSPSKGQTTQQTTYVQSSGVLRSNSVGEQSANQGHEAEGGVNRSANQGHEAEGGVNKQKSVEYRRYVPYK